MNILHNRLIFLVTSNSMVTLDQLLINTISYNGDYPHLKDLSLLNEGAFIRADSDDVAYKLASFFNSEL